MHKKSRLLIAIAGAGLIGLLTGCGQEEAQIVPINPVRNVTPENSKVVDNSVGAKNPTETTQNQGSLLQPAESSGNNNSGGNSSSDVTPAGDSSVNPNTNNNSANGDSNSNSNSNSNNKTDDSGVELIALVDSEEEAQEVANLYGITLKSYSLGVAVYYATSQEPQTIIQMGIDKGYPQLSLNHEMHLFQ